MSKKNNNNRNINVSNDKDYCEDKNTRNRSKGTNNNSKAGNASRHGRFGSDVKQNKFNDPSWYANNPQLLVDSSSLAFSNATGTEFRLESYSGNTYGGYTGQSMPGILSFAVAPLPGNTQETNSPVNLAARQIYGFVRHANSGSANYDAPNLMMYLLAMDSCYSMYSFLIRAYSIISYYSVRNRYCGRGLIESMGLDYDDLLRNLANFRAFINTFADKIGALVVPKGMPYFIRHMWMYANIYRDSDHEKSQFYIYNPEYFYLYNETAGSQGKPVGSLIPFFFKGFTSGLDKTQPGLKGYIEIVDLVNTMIDRVMGSEDCGIMSGDILKAYGDAGVWHLSTIPAEVAIEPVFDLEVLTQFHNVFTIANESSDIPATFGTITQDIVGTELQPILKLDNTLDTSTDYSLPSRVLDLPYSMADPGHIMVATRLNALCTSIAKEDPGAPKPFDTTLIECGSEVICYMELYYYRFNNFQPILAKVPFGSICDLTTEIEDGDADYFFNSEQGMMHVLSKIEKFAFHPYIYLVYNAGTSYSIYDIVGDIDNYTSVSITELRKMNTTALLSEFDTPQAAVWSLK